MGHKHHLSGEQQDAFTRWRHRLHWRAGELRKTKRRASRQYRQEARREISDQRRQD